MSNKANSNFQISNIYFKNINFSFLRKLICPTKENNNHSIKIRDLLSIKMDKNEL